VAKGLAVKVAVTVAAEVTAQVEEEPEQVPPPQLVNEYPLAGVSVKVTVPEADESEQVPVVPVVQLMTESEEVTVPLPTIEEIVMV
jgi:hypothetical protein